MYLLQGYCIGLHNILRYSCCFVQPLYIPTYYYWLWAVTVFLQLLLHHQHNLQAMWLVKLITWIQGLCPVGAGTSSDWAAQTQPRRWDSHWTVLAPTEPLISQKAPNGQKALFLDLWLQGLWTDSSCSGEEMNRTMSLLLLSVTCVCVCACLPACICLPVDQNSAVEKKS